MGGRIEDGSSALALDSHSGLKAAVNVAVSLLDAAEAKSAAGGSCPSAPPRKYERRWSVKEKQPI